ncbi:ATP-binding cassette domain-containing protein [Limibacter armeniacum]|uniref:peptidase domain-containing ABC transporter n=1 Tax=Limibacter armeniacum TaxID=466084 RepID=UPI002FE50D83
MNATQFIPICERLAALIKHDYQGFKLEDQFHNSYDYQGNFDAFLEGLSNKAQKINMATLHNRVPKSELMELLRHSHFPILAFFRSEDHLTPVILHYDHKDATYTAYYYEGTQEYTTNHVDSIIRDLVTDLDDTVEYTAPVGLNPIVSDSESRLGKVSSPVSRLFALLNAEKRDIFYIYFYALIISVISLVLPVGVQAVIETIAGGVVFDSIALLIAIVVIATMVAGGLQIMQVTLVEIIQRRIFVKASLEITYRLPRMKVEAIMGHYAPELMNRFFDVLTIQKSLPKLLIDFSAAVLQILFGMILLSFYHPFFIVFGLVLIMILAVLFYMTGPKALEASLTESKYKYKVAHWLEEIARTLFSFKLAGHTSLPINKADHYTNNYLHYRKKLFQVMISQYTYIVIFKTLVTGGLLTIGTFLVINREISLGQFVASEIVIVLVLGAVEKLILNIDTIYHSLTAVEKIGNVTDIPLERKGGIYMPSSGKGMDIRIKDLSYTYPTNPKSKVINNLNLEIAAGERVCITGYNNSGKDTLVKLLSGFFESFEGVITMNNVSIRDVNLSSLRDNISKNVSEEELFDGTILENITMGRARVTHKDVVWALESVGLWDFVNAQPNGLQTEISAGGKVYSSSIASRFILARCIADKPKLLILNKALQEIEKRERLRIISFLMAKENPWTLICISGDPLLMTVSDKVIVMENGNIVCQGHYQDLLHEPKFTDCMIRPDDK